MKKRKHKHKVDLPISSYFMMFVGFGVAFFILLTMLNELAK
jgi:hypothetical protein